MLTITTAVGNEKIRESVKRTCPSVADARLLVRGLSAVAATVFGSTTLAADGSLSVDAGLARLLLCDWQFRRINNVLSSTECRYCGTAIRFLRTTDGKAIPVELDGVLHRPVCAQRKGEK